MAKILDEITINNYQYKFKNELVNDYYSYRCKYRTACKILVKINKENLIKLKENSTDNIEYTITSNETIHKCKKKTDLDILSFMNKYNDKYKTKLILIIYYNILKNY